MNVGKVSGMQLAKDGKAVEVKVKIEDSAKGLPKSETQFWLRGAEPSLFNPASLSLLLSGPTDSIAQLDATLQQVHQTAESAGPQITDVVKALDLTELDQ
jgi:hypothetical protein